MKRSEWKKRGGRFWICIGAIACGALILRAADTRDLRVTIEEGTARSQGGLGDQVEIRVELGQADGDFFLKTANMTWACGTGKSQEESLLGKDERPEISPGNFFRRQTGLKGIAQGSRSILLWLAPLRVEVSVSGVYYSAANGDDNPLNEPPSFVWVRPWPVARRLGLIAGGLLLPAMFIAWRRKWWLPAGVGMAIAVADFVSCYGGYDWYRAWLPVIADGFLGGALLSAAVSAASFWLGNLVSKSRSDKDPKLQGGSATDAGNATVFISHSSEDTEFVGRLARALKERGERVFVAVQEIGVGDSVVQRISNALGAARFLIVVLSEASLKSRWVQAELNAALMDELSTQRIRVLPVMVGDCELPPLLRDRLFADFRISFEKGLERLLEALSLTTTDGGNASVAFPKVGQRADDATEQGVAGGTFGPSRTGQGADDDCSSRLARLPLLELAWRLSERLSKNEVASLWWWVFEDKMEESCGHMPRDLCVQELVMRVKRERARERLCQSICKTRPDVAE